MMRNAGREKLLGGSLTSWMGSGKKGRRAGKETKKEKKLSKRKKERIVEITDFFFPPLLWLVGRRMIHICPVRMLCPLTTPSSSSAPFLVWWPTFSFSLAMPSKKKEEKRKKKKKK